MNYVIYFLLAWTFFPCRGALPVHWGQEQPQRTREQAKILSLNPGQIEPRGHSCGWHSRFHSSISSLPRGGGTLHWLLGDNKTEASSPRSRSHEAEASLLPVLYFQRWKSIASPNSVKFCSYENYQQRNELCKCAMFNSCCIWRKSGP